MELSPGPVLKITFHQHCEFSSYSMSVHVHIDCSKLKGHTPPPPGSSPLFCHVSAPRLYYHAIMQQANIQGREAIV